ncbi:VOC family protein [Allokutzneria sp. NRRL B-24872]|uniref:VOC family protein n=1 Tax=Allokutzneria sp. NRRL B-24872 TaxID=1137961 RepID=UPI000A35E434|nr:VOC family protein [Allokutzneria sp. NRRL B-24872]
MTSRLNPYLSFTDNARQAMEFYREVFGGELAVNTFGEFGMTESADLVMHSLLTTDAGFALMGADTPPGMEHRKGSSITVCVNGDDAETLHGYWDKLIEGGTVETPLEKQMWGDEYGACEDRFGIPWMFNISQPQG